MAAWKRCLKPLLFKFGLVAFGAGLALALGEAGIRVLFRSSLPVFRAELRSRAAAARGALESGSGGQGVFRWHPYYCYTFAPLWQGTRLLRHSTRFSTDALGFRNTPFDLAAAPPGEWVIGLFGGSAVFGDGIDGNENTLPSQLESFLRRESGRAVRVVNFGMPAWQYPQQFFAVSRLLDQLDMIVTCDGFNEILVPYWNWWDNPGGRLATDFPPHFAYRLFADSLDPRRAAAALPLLEYENAYRPDGPAARSALYVWWRYRRTLAQGRALESAALRFGAVAADHPAPAPAGSGRERLEFETSVRTGAAQWLRYSRLVDAVSARRGLPVLHAIQPFRYASASSPVAPGDLQKNRWTRLFFTAPHPASWYSILRKSAGAAYAPSAQSEPRILFADLAEAVPPDGSYWKDYIHPSRAGARIAAEALGRRILEAGVLRAAPVPRPGLPSPEPPPAPAKE